MQVHSAHLHVMPTNWRSSRLSTNLTINSNRCHHEIQLIDQDLGVDLATRANTRVTLDSRDSGALAKTIL